MGMGMGMDMVMVMEKVMVERWEWTGEGCGCGDGNTDLNECDSRLLLMSRLTVFFNQVGERLSSIPSHDPNFD